MIHHIHERGLNFPIDTYQVGARANKWRQTVLKVISPLLEAAKEMWKIKETSRRELLLGIPTDQERLTQARRLRKRTDIRNWFRRIEHKVGTLRHILVPCDLDTTPVADLLREPVPAPLTTTRLVRITQNKDTPKPPLIRWKNTHIQDFFVLNRTNSKLMMAKNLPPNVRPPFQRSLYTGHWDDNIDLKWLPPKRDEQEDAYEDQDTALASIDSVNREQGNHKLDVDDDNYNKLLSELNLNNCSSSNFIFCDRDCNRSSNNNEKEDDATKRRGIGYR